ncbi:MAG: SRPBCC family protein [bacterium]
MTEIRRSIEISAPKEKVWSFINPKNWADLFDSVESVDGYNDGQPGVGTKASVVAGNDALTTIKYRVEITEFLESNRIVYRRYGGPLSGKGIIELKELQIGTLLERVSQYDDDLSENILDTLSAGMEKDNLKIKQLVEADR